MLVAVSGKVVYLDKPLLPKGLSQCQRKTQYLQKALRAFVCQPLNDRKMAGSRGRDERARCEDAAEQAERVDVGHSHMLEEDGDDDPFGAAFSMDDLETFGSDKLSSLSSTKLPSLKPDAPVVSLNATSFRKDREEKMATEESSTEVPISACVDGGKAKWSQFGSEADAGDVQSVPENITTTETETVTKAEADVMVKSEPTARQQQASPDRSVMKRCLRSSVLPNQDASSDSEDDALVIALPDSPAKGWESPAKPSQSQQHLMSRRSKDSKSSIFDEIPAPATPAPEESRKDVQVNSSVTRRITRSSSQRLQSPDKACVPAASETAPRATRQGSKRRLHDFKAEAEADIPVVENPVSTKKGDKTGGEADNSGMDDQASTKKAKKTEEKPRKKADSFEADSHMSTPKAKKPVGEADRLEADGQRSTKKVPEPVSEEGQSSGTKGQAGVSHTGSASEQQNRRQCDKQGKL